MSSYIYEVIRLCADIGSSRFQEVAHVASLKEVVCPEGGNSACYTQIQNQDILHIIAPQRAQIKNKWPQNPIDGLHTTGVYACDIKEESTVLIPNGDYKQMFMGNFWEVWEIADGALPGPIKQYHPMGPHEPIRQTNDPQPLKCTTDQLAISGNLKY